MPWVLGPRVADGADRLALSWTVPWPKSGGWEVPRGGGHGWGGHDGRAGGADGARARASRLYVFRASQTSTCCHRAVDSDMTLAKIFYAHLGDAHIRSCPATARIDTKQPEAGWSTFCKHRVNMIGEGAEHHADLPRPPVVAETHAY